MGLDGWWLLSPRSLAFFPTPPGQYKTTAPLAVAVPFCSHQLRFNFAILTSSLLRKPLWPTRFLYTHLVTFPFRTALATPLPRAVFTIPSVSLSPPRCRTPPPRL